MAAPEAWRGPSGAQGSTGGCLSSNLTLQSLCSHLSACPTPVSLSFYFSFLIPRPFPPCPGIGKWHELSFSLLKVGSSCLGPEGSTRAGPHFMVQGWRSCSGCTGGDFAELKQRDGAGGDPEHRGTQAHSCHQPHGRKQESLLDSPSTYLEKLRTRWIFLSKTGAKFLCHLCHNFQAPQPLAPPPGAVWWECGPAGEGASMLLWAYWSQYAHTGPSMLKPILQSCTHVVFPVVKPSGAQHTLAWRRARGQNRHWDNGNQKNAENFKPLEY